MVIENICFMLNQFIRCSAYSNIIFGWVMHEQSIIDSILDELIDADYEIKKISLIADEDNLRSRLNGDIEKGIRSKDVVERSVSRIPLYQTLDTIKVDTSNKSIQKIADEIACL